MLPRLGIFNFSKLKLFNMSKNTFILIGDKHEKFIKEQVDSGNFTSASEVVKASLRLFECEERKKEILIKKLEEGEQSGFANDYSEADFLKLMHEKYISNQ